MSWFAEYIAWGLVFIVQIFFIGATAFSAMGYIEASNMTGYEIDLEDQALRESKDGLLWATVGFAILSAIFACMICCGWSQLKLAIDVIDASADFLAKTKRLIFVPMGYFVAQMIVFSLWLGCLSGINSNGEFIGEKNQQRRVNIDDS